MDFQRIVAESETVQAGDFMNLVDEAAALMGGEQGKVGNQSITDALVELAPVGEALVVGDLHGSLESLAAIMQKSRFPDKLAKSKDTSVIFLGDYGDRGYQSPEVYYCVLCLKRAFPEQVVLLRGNHEGPSDLMASPHDLPRHLQRKFKDKWGPAYQKLRELFERLYVAVHVEGRYLMLHGGLPVKIRSIEDLAQAVKLHPEKPFLEEILWNDPEESIKGTYPSARGAGNLFGEAITKDALEKLYAKVLIRGHEVASEGYKINHGGRVLTLFSVKGEPYFNRTGAYLELPLQPVFDSAEQLLPYVGKF